MDVHLKTSTALPDLPQTLAAQGFAAARIFCPRETRAHFDRARAASESNARDPAPE
jgi:hypothetical protein